MANALIPVITAVQSNMVLHTQQGAPKPGWGGQNWLMGAQTWLMGAPKHGLRASKPGFVILELDGQYCFLPVVNVMNKSLSNCIFLRIYTRLVSAGGWGALSPASSHSNLPYHVHWVVRLGYKLIFCGPLECKCRPSIKHGCKVPSLILNVIIWFLRSPYHQVVRTSYICLLRSM